MKTLMTQVSKYKNLELAKESLKSCKKLNLIILGENNEYWVSTPSVTEQLNKMGYEYL